MTGELAPMHAPFLMFAGGKGGVGKTTLAANLGVQIAREGLRVLLADLDLGLGNLGVFLRLTPRRTVEDVLRGDARAEECVVRGPGGVYVLPAGSGSAEMGRDDAELRARIAADLARLSGSFDLVIGDGAAGIGPDVLAFATRADHVLCVTTPEPAALTDAYGLIKAIDTFSHEAGAEVPTPELIINLVDGAAQAGSTADKLRRVCERFLMRSPRMAGWLPRSPAVLRSATTQQPFALDARPGQERALENTCLQMLSARLQRRHTPRAGALST